MNASRTFTALLAATLAVCSVQAEEAVQGDSLIDKTGRAVGKGAKAAADGAEYVAEKVVHGVKRGADAVERGGRATGKALGNAANKVGISDKGQQGAASAPAGAGAGAVEKP